MRQQCENGGVQKKTNDFRTRQSTTFNHPRQRYILNYCRNAPNTTIGIRELATAVGTAESSTRKTTISDKRYRLIEIDLHHSHLPKLTTAGFIEYDPVATVIHYDGRKPKA